MPFEKVEFSFPDPDNEEESPDIEVKPSSAVKMVTPSKGSAKSDDTDFEVEVVDDTPKADRGRKVSDPPDEVTDEELEDYSDKVRNRIKHFSKGYHDERRAKETAFREREELERYTQQLIEENKGLKSSQTKNQTVLLDQAKRSAGSELEIAKREFKEAHEAGDTDALVEAQEKLTTAKIKADRLSNIQLPSLLHNKLAKQGMDLQSDEYYETINARMRKVFPEEFEDTEEEKVTPKRQANVVAPATRSTSPKKIVLTQTQVNLAKRLGVSLEDYAKQVAIEMRKDANG